MKFFWRERAMKRKKILIFAKSLQKRLVWRHKILSVQEKEKDHRQEYSLKTPVVLRLHGGQSNQTQQVQEFAGLYAIEKRRDQVAKFPFLPDRHRKEFAVQGQRVVRLYVQPLFQRLLPEYSLPIFQGESLL